MTRRYESQQLLLGLFIFLCVFSLVRQITEALQIPRDSDYVLVKDKLLELNYQEGTDALAILPAWSLRPLQSLGDFNPIGADFLHRLPVVPYERLFVLKEADADKPMEAISRIYGPTLQSWVLGRIELHLFEAQAHAQGTFSENLDDAIVTLGQKDNISDCIWRDNAHHCNQGSKTLQVRKKWMRTTQNASQLVAIVPPGPKNTLKITFPNQRAAPFLILFGGHTRKALSKNPRKVTIQVFLNQKKIKTVRWGQDFPMALESIAIPASIPSPQELTFLIEGFQGKKSAFGFDGFWAAKPADAEQQ